FALPVALPVFQLSAGAGARARLSSRAERGILPGNGLSEAEKIPRSARDERHARADAARATAAQPTMHHRTRRAYISAARFTLDAVRRPPCPTCRTESTNPGATSSSGPAPTATSARSFT